MAEVKKEENKNMEIYNQVREVPKEAQKPIGAGRLKGMTDIKPQWRIEKLTEVFGACGFGWKTVIKNKEIIEGANEEKIAIVDIDLFVKVNGEWSEAIEGTGGSSFVAKESKGLYTSDECFKMAYTDALSVACKALGVGANVYWGDSKYIKANDDKKDVLISEAQIGVIKKIFNTDERMKKLLDKYKIKKIEDMSKELASNIIKKNLGGKNE